MNAQALSRLKGELLKFPRFSMVANTIHTIRYGTMPAGDPQGLCAGLADDVVALLAQRPDLKVGLLCDGAPEMWNLWEEEFTKAPFNTREIIVQRLIDFWHAIEKLAPAAKTIAGDDEAANSLLGSPAGNCSCATAAAVAHVSWVSCKPRATRTLSMAAASLSTKRSPTLPTTPGE